MCGTSSCIAKKMGPLLFQKSKQEQCWSQGGFSGSIQREPDTDDLSASSVPGLRGWENLIFVTVSSLFRRIAIRNPRDILGGQKFTQNKGNHGSFSRGREIRESAGESDKESLTRGDSRRADLDIGTNVNQGL